MLTPTCPPASYQHAGSIPRAGTTKYPSMSARALFSAGCLRLLTCSTVLAGSLTVDSSSSAQDAACGVVTGRVLNAATDRYLGNARIRVQGTEIQTFTNSFGEFRLGNVP